MLKIFSGHTYHARRGEIENAFRYSVDYLLHDFQETPDAKLFSIDRFNLWSLRTADHGGMPKSGKGVKWFEQILAEHGFDPETCDKLLITDHGFYGLNLILLVFGLRQKTVHQLQ